MMLCQLTRHTKFRSDFVLNFVLSPFSITKFWHKKDGCNKGEGWQLFHILVLIVAVMRRFPVLGRGPRAPVTLVVELLQTKQWELCGAEWRSGDWFRTGVGKT